MSTAKNLKRSERCTLLIDGDIIAFGAVSAALEDFEWSPGIWTTYCDHNAARAKFHRDIERIVEEMDKHTKRTVEVVLCITGTGNFRRDVLPTYKGHRKRKPPGYIQFQEWILNESGYETFLRPGLEADDCLGILSTAGLPQHADQRVIWSADKDLMQIPGLHLDYDVKRRSPSKLLTVTERAGEILHVRQTLTGDVTDGYTGLVGYGPKSVEKLLEKHKDADLSVVWKEVLGEYEKKGKTLEDMLQQSRVARILRASDYDFKKKEPILWAMPTS